MISVFKKIDQFFEKFSTYLLLLALWGMLLLSVINIVLRWFNSTIIWIDPFVRHLVFLSAFLGGSLAVSSHKHIRIDMFMRILEKWKKEHLKFIVEWVIVLVTLLSTILLVKAGIDLVKVESEFGKVHFLGIHSAFLVGIIPFGMSLISLRLFMQLFVMFHEEIKEEQD